MARFLSAAPKLADGREHKNRLCAALVIVVGSDPGRFILGESWNFSAFLCPAFTLDRRKMENWPTVVMLVPELVQAWAA